MGDRTRSTASTASTSMPSCAPAAGSRQSSTQSKLAATATLRDNWRDDCRLRPPDHPMRAVLTASLLALALLSACSDNGDELERARVDNEALRQQLAATATTQAAASPSPAATATAPATATSTPAATPATSTPAPTQSGALTPTTTATPAVTVTPSATPSVQRTSAASQPTQPVGGSLRERGATALAAVDNRSLAAPARNTLFACGS